MKLSAFTLIKNAVKFDYPIIESINSVINEVDEYIINIGLIDEDGTEDLIVQHFGHNTKVRLIYSDWETKEQGTAFFSNQTNKSLDVATGDWCIYLQADECFHEEDLPKIRKAIESAELQGKQGIICDYLHFEKNPRTIRKTYSDGFDAYDSEIRILKNNGNLVSFGDAQSFCFMDDLMDPRGPQPAMHRKDRLYKSDIKIYHYGYLKDPKKLYQKKKELDEFYKVEHPGRKEEIMHDADGNYVFDNGEKLKEFKGTHPSVMLSRLERY